METEGEREGGEDPRFAQFVQMIGSMEDATRLEQMIGMLSTRLEGVDDPEERARMESLMKIANDRLKELEAAEGE